MLSFAALEVKAGAQNCEYDEVVIPDVRLCVLILIGILVGSLGEIDLHHFDSIAGVSAIGRSKSTGVEAVELVANITIGLFDGHLL